MRYRGSLKWLEGDAEGVPVPPFQRDAALPGLEMRPNVPN